MNIFSIYIYTSPVNIHCQLDCTNMSRRSGKIVTNNTPEVNNHNGLHIGQCNVQSLNNKFEQVKDFIYLKCMDVFGVCETFLSDKNLNKEVVIKGYDIVRKDRLSSVGTRGGLLVYIKKVFITYDALSWKILM